MITVVPPFAFLLVGQGNAVIQVYMLVKTEKQNFKARSLTLPTHPVCLHYNKETCGNTEGENKPRLGHHRAL